MMENGHPGSLPWLASFQICSDLNTIYNYKKKCSKLLHINATNSKSNEKISFKNNVEYYWDRKILGQLSCKRGNFRENLGDELESYDNDGDPTYIYSLKFCPKEASHNILAIATEEGTISLVNTSSSSSVINEFHAHRNAIFDVAWMPETDDKLISVSGDMTAKLWDAERGQVDNEVSSFKAHGRSVKCIEFRPFTQNEFATGSRDNSICLWDTRDSSKPQNTIRNAHAIQTSTLTPKSARRSAHSRRLPKETTIIESNIVTFTKGSVTTLQFQDNYTLISASDLDGIIKVWDLRRSYDLYSGIPKPKYTIPYAGKYALNGYSSMILDSSKTKLYASCKDHTVYQFDVGQYENKSPLNTFVGHTNGSKFFVRISLSADDRYLVSGSSDNSAYIWNTTLQNSMLGRKPIATLQGHEAEVTCVEFSKEKIQPKLVTCSDDFKCKIWRTHPPNDLKENSEGLPIFCGNVSWNEETDAYTKGPTFQSKIRNDSTTIVFVENKSKRKLFSDVLDNDENMSANFQQSNQSKRCKTEGVYQKSVIKFAAYPSSSRMTNVLASPSKVSHSSIGVLQSPKKLNITPKKSKIVNDIREASYFLSSPTGNLPNIVLDGRSPHEKLISNSASSGQKTKKGTHKVDWLTEMGQQKKNSLPKNKLSKQQLTPVDQNKEESVNPVP